MFASFLTKENGNNRSSKDQIWHYQYILFWEVPTHSCTESTEPVFRSYQDSVSKSASLDSVFPHCICVYVWDVLTHSRNGIKLVLTDAFIVDQVSPLTLKPTCLCEQYNICELRRPKPQQVVEMLEIGPGHHRLISFTPLKHNVLNEPLDV